MLSNFLSNGRSRSRTLDRRFSDERKRRQLRSRRLLALENLEERVVLSTMFVNHLWAGEALGAIVEVDDSGTQGTIGTDAFATIQSAINAAAVVDPEAAPAQEPDEIRIAGGTYAETLRINKSLRLVGEGSDKVVIDVREGTATGGVYVLNRTTNVSLSGFKVSGETSNDKVRYGVYAAGVSGLNIDDVIVETTSRSGINLNGVTDFTISNATVIDTTGAGVFMTDVKRGELSNITTSGNDWAGVAFSTYGRDHEIGVEAIVISGNIQLAESGDTNGAVMLEEARWDKEAKAFAPDPKEISFSTNLEDGKDVTFDFGEGEPWLGYFLTGKQSDSDSWKVRYNFYGTLAQGLNAADALPTHYTGEDLVLSPLAPTTGAPILSGPAEIDRGSIYTLTLSPSTGAGNGTEWLIDWGDGTIETIASAEAEATHTYANAAADYTISVTEIVEGLYESGAATLGVSVVNVDPTIAITGAPSGDVARGSAIELGADAGGPDVDVMTYSWVVTLGGEEFDSGDEANFSFTPDLPGVYTVTLTATGRFGLEATASETITVVNADPTVVIDGVPSGSVARNQGVTLTADGDDPDGDLLTYAWAVTFNGAPFASGSGVEFTLTPSLPGEYLVSLIASDPHGGSASATATIVAANANPNVAITGAPGSLNQGQAATLGSTASDPDGDALTYAWSVTRGETVVLTGDATNLYFAPTVPGNYLVTLTVTDPHGGSATATEAIAVLGAAPTVTITGAPGSVNQGESIHLGSEVVNPAGGALTHAWTVTRDGVVVHTGDGETLDFTPLVPGNYVVTLTVTDIDGDSGTASHAIGVANVAPDVVIAPLPETPVMSGDVVTLAATATDPNPNAELSYAWTITRNGVFMGQANQAALQFVPLFSGLYEATLVVSDGEGGVTTRSVQFEVQTNLPPAAEQAVEALQQRADVQIARQQMRIDALSQRYDDNPPPFVQRTINRMVQTQIRMQNMVARRMMMLQRLFSRQRFR